MLSRSLSRRFRSVAALAALVLVYSFHANLHTASASLSDRDWWSEFLGADCDEDAEPSSEHLHCALNFSGPLATVLQSPLPKFVANKSTATADSKNEDQQDEHVDKISAIVSWQEEAKALFPPLLNKKNLIGDTLKWLLDREIGARILPKATKPLSGSVSAAVRLVAILHSNVLDSLIHMLLIRRKKLKRPDGSSGITRQEAEKVWAKLEKEEKKAAGSNKSDGRSDSGHNTRGRMFESALELELFQVGLQNAGFLKRNKKFLLAKRTEFPSLLRDPLVAQLFHKTRRVTLLETRLDERFGYKLDASKNFWIPGLPSIAEPILRGHPLLFDLEKIGKLPLSLLETKFVPPPEDKVASSYAPGVLPDEKMEIDSRLVMHPGRLHSGCNEEVLPVFCDILQASNFQQEAASYVFGPTELRRIRRGSWTQIGGMNSASCESNAGILLLYNGAIGGKKNKKSELFLDVITQEPGGEKRLPPGKAAAVDECRYPASVSIVDENPSAARSTSSKQKKDAILLVVRVWHPLVPPSERARLGEILLKERVAPDLVRKMVENIGETRRNYSVLAQDWLAVEQESFVEQTMFSTSAEAPKSDVADDEL
ncbi:unnamed protein product [Amoebophrya sp. A120]|nr:unnamed protein product [Amoebophrya sp. A120]|eukprot:GSA120T00011441001.1